MIKQKPTDKVLADFSLPESMEAPVIVRLKGSEIIGRIYQDFGDGEGAVTYTPISKDGEELCLPTNDWCTVEEACHKYASKLSEKYLTEERDKRWNEIADKYEELETIRQRKNHRTRKHELTR